ncbi:hypothetical protein AB1Y20_020369 [Prymnesium parvum]|uniref:ATP-dependent helicase ATRX n=1 Tax=Prymnesium parvum TaxID=97485 RepID=A0AB34JT74_PRYPA
MRRTGAAPEWRDANVDAAPAKIPRRVVPTPVPLNSTGTVQSEAPSSAPPARSPSPADPMDTEQRSVDEEEGSESEHLDLDDRESRDKMLMNLSDEEKQALVDQMLEAMGAVDHYAEMLEGGPPDRPLGKKCEAVCDARIQVEKESLEDLVTEMREEGLPMSGPEFEQALTERSAEWREEYEDLLQEEYDKALERSTQLQEDVEAAGMSVAAVNKVFRENEKTVWADGSLSENEGKGEKCEACGRGGAFPFEPREHESAPDAVESGISNEARGSGPILCYVCSAEKELKARAPVKVKHGRVMECGASGFTGWTEGLRRTNDSSTLRKMYSFKRPSEVEAFEKELAVDEAGEVDELESDEEGGKPGTLSDGGLSDASSESEQPLVYGSRRYRRRLQESWEAEGDEYVTRKWRTKKDKAERHCPLATCTACGHPFFECVQVYEHPTLRVALCSYCFRKQSSATDGEAAMESGDAGRCEWCAELEADDASFELFGCDEKGWPSPRVPCLTALATPRIPPDDVAVCAALRSCTRWFCTDCISRNLGGTTAVERVRAASPWACFACDSSPLSQLRETYAKLHEARERAKLKAERASHKKRGARSSRDRPPAPRHEPFAPPKPRKQREEEEEEEEGGSPPLVLREERQDSEGNHITAVSVLGRLAAKLKPHQVDGIRFMWSACMGDDMRKQQEHGVVLAHSMGLGKTLSVCVFVHTILRRAFDTHGNPYIRYRKGCPPAPPKDGQRVDPPNALILVPKAVATQWEREFRKWIGNDDKLRVSIMGTSSQLQQLRMWKYMGGVLIMNHDTFWRLAAPNNQRGSRQGKAAAPLQTDDNLAEFETLLLSPGPDVIVIDEAHRIKNDTTSLSRVLMRVRTQRRILLTGTPLQNNLLEYFHMVNYVKPGYLGDEKRFKQLYEERIQLGQTRDGAAIADRRSQMNRRVWALSQKLDQLVQRKGYDILQAELPRRLELVITVRLTEIQRHLYNIALKRVPDDIRGGKLFHKTHELRRVFNHPSILVVHANSPKQQKSAVAAADADEEEVDNTFDLSAWWHSVWPTNMLTPDEIFLASLSGKMVVMLEILKQAALAEEKVLLFSQSLETLTVIENVLQRAPSPRSCATGCWQKGLDYLRFDGLTSAEERDMMMTSFNDPALRIRLFLISTKAGGQGLNLAAASRVILFDASWNPSNDTQAVYRAYRYGQTRPVVVYRLIAEGFEQCMYRQQVVKLQLAGRVLDDQTLEATYTEKELKDLWQPVLLAPGAPPLEMPSLASSDLELSWMRQLVTPGSPFTHWVAAVEDHQMSLENMEESLTSRDKEDAANEFVRDMNALSREEAVCFKCHTPDKLITFDTLELKCKSCGASTMLPPAAPLVKRPDGPGHLMFEMHGEQSDPETGLLKRSILSEGGIYQLQWREVAPNVQLGPDENWKDPKKPFRRGSTISKRNLSSEKQYQMRVRARPKACICGKQANEHLECAAANICVWTPWSQPSVLATPQAAQATAAPVM